MAVSDETALRLFQSLLKAREQLAVDRHLLPAADGTPKGLSTWLEIYTTLDELDAMLQFMIEDASLLLKSEPDFKPKRRTKSGSTPVGEVSQAPE